MTKITKNIDTLNKNIINLNFKRFNKKYFKHLSNNLLCSEIIADSGWQPISTSVVGDVSAQSNDHNYLNGNYNFIFKFPKNLIPETMLKNLNFLIVGKKTGSVTPVAGGNLLTYDYSSELIGYDIYNGGTKVFDVKTGIYTYPGNVCQIAGTYQDGTNVNNVLYEIAIQTEDETFESYLHESLYYHRTYNWIAYKEYLVVRNFTSVSIDADTFHATGTGVRIGVNITLNHTTLKYEYEYSYNIETVTVDVPLNYADIFPTPHGGIGTVGVSLKEAGFFDSQRLFPIIGSSNPTTLSVPLSSRNSIYYQETELPENEYWIELIPNPPFDDIHDIYRITYESPPLSSTELDALVIAQGPDNPDIQTEEVVIKESEIYLSLSSVVAGEQSFIYTEKSNSNIKYLDELRVQGRCIFTTNIMETLSVGELTYYRPLVQDVEIKCLINYTAQESNSKEYDD